MLLACCLMSFMPKLSLAGPAADAVESLPGFDGPLPSKHYSGYLPTGKATGVAGQLHYWLIEAENDPETAPVALWLNGGPGSSSLIGLLTENGQVATNANSMTQNTSDVPKLFYNPYSWSQVAHVVYLEQPKGVGFSYCEDPEVGCTNTDESTAEDAYEALVNFFDEKFPEYKSKDFYITGESYAGT
jgi:carboxypeptidase C (cathepsin A)